MRACKPGKERLVQVHKFLQTHAYPHMHINVCVCIHIHNIHTYIINICAK